VRRHHRVFYAVLLASLVEWLARGRPAQAWQLVGVALFALGVAGYRRAGRALGDQLSPLVRPREPARLVDAGPYRRVRHPMYRAELAMAFGAPLVLAACYTLALSIVFLGLVLHRIGVEEQALAVDTPDFPAYAARTKRLVPHVY
jgi:protein-S-isoprenylcysteine O-methyltransferase Ste14